MASVHCQRSCEESCQQKQKQQHSSLGQKVSELFKGHHNSNTQTQTQCQAAGCHGRSSTQHKKKNLVQKIKDTFSSDSSDDDSDNENCHGRKK